MLVIHLRPQSSDGLQTASDVTDSILKESQRSSTFSVMSLHLYKLKLPKCLSFLFNLNLVKRCTLAAILYSSVSNHIFQGNYYKTLKIEVYNRKCQFNS